MRRDEYEPSVVRLMITLTVNAYGGIFVELAAKSLLAETSATDCRLPVAVLLGV
jgi:hypothetical protein